jgi:hypothetical protein
MVPVFTNPTASSAYDAVTYETEALRLQFRQQPGLCSAAFFDRFGISPVNAGPVRRFKRVDVAPLRGRGVPRGGKGRPCRQQQRGDD